VLTNEAARNRILSARRSGALRAGRVARIAVFLASDDASYLTGTTVYPDGGRWLELRNVIAHWLVEDGQHAVKP